MMLHLFQRQNRPNQTLYGIVRFYESPSASAATQGHCAFFSSNAVKAMNQESDQIVWFKEQSAAEKELAIRGSFHGLYEFHLPSTFISEKKGHIQVQMQKIEPGMIASLRFHTETGIQPPTVNNTACTF